MFVDAIAQETEKKKLFKRKLPAICSRLNAFEFLNTPGVRQYFG